MKHILTLSTLLFLSCNSLPTEEERNASVEKEERKVLSVAIPNVQPQAIKQPNIEINSNRLTTRSSFEGVYKNKRYKFIEETTSWHDASAKAKELGGTLACLDTEDKLSYVHLLMKIHNHSVPAWVGLTDQDKEGDWQWICGQRFHPKMRSWLEIGEDLDARDFAHYMPARGFLSRVNSGKTPNLSNTNKRASRPIKGYIVEFENTTVDTQTNPVETHYELTQPTLYAELQPIREEIRNWRGGKDVLQQAQQQLESIIKKDETFAPAYKELANAFINMAMVNANYYRHSELAIAEAHLYKAIQLEPNYAQAYVVLANLLTKAKRYGEAPVALYNAAAMNADEISLHLKWGSLKLKKRQSKTALEHLQVAQNLTTKGSKSYQSALGLMTSAYVNLKKLPEAIATYEELLELRPEDAWTWGNYASFLFYRMQNTDGAIEAYRKALSLKDYGMARSHLAYALYTKWAMLKDNPNTAGQAQSYFDEAYILSPNIKYVIARLMAYKHTQSVAFALQQWQIENHNMEPKESNQST